MPRFNRGGSEKGERAGLERRRGEGKEKVEGMTEGRGKKEGMGNSDGGKPHSVHYISELINKYGTLLRYVY